MVIAEAPEALMFSILDKRPSVAPAVFRSAEVADKVRVSVPVPPSRVSAPTKPTKVSLPNPPINISSPAPPVIESSPSPPSIRSTPEPPVKVSFPPKPKIKWVSELLGAAIVLAASVPVCT